MEQSHLFIAFSMSIIYRSVAASTTKIHLIFSQLEQTHRANIKREQERPIDRPLVGVELLRGLIFALGTHFD